MTEFIHKFSAKLPCDRSRAFAALSDAGALADWFAERVEIGGLTPGDAFSFWGRDVMSVATAEEARQTLLAIEPQHALSFSWRILDTESTVAWRLEPADAAGECVLKIEHRFNQRPAASRAVELIDDLWRFHCGNLVNFLNHGERAATLNFDDPSPEVRQSIWIDAPRDAVFRALVEPDLLAKWIATKDASVDARQGGDYSYGWTYEVDGKSVTGGPTRILDYVENEKLVTDWPDWRGDASVPVQSVAWVLADENGGTRVTVIHSGFIRPTDVSDYPFGWGDFVKALAAVFEASS